MGFMAEALSSRVLRRYSLRKARAATKRVVRNNQPEMTVPRRKAPAFRASRTNTDCATSSARCGSRTWRNAAE